MQTPDTTTTQRAKHHPMMIAAAIAVILFCLAGTAAVMGWLPSSISGASSQGDLTASDRAALASSLNDGKAPEPTISAAERERLAARERAEERERERIAARRSEVASTAATPARNWCNNCGNVESVREVTQRAQGSGLGAAGGAVLGGLLGNQIGDGSGKKIATAAGAVGGAVVGNQIEGNMKATRAYEIRVRLDDGSARTFTRKSLDGYSTGDRVKVVDGQLRHAG